MHMVKHNQYGAVNVLLFPLIVAGVLFIGAASFGIWAYGERTNYKENVDQIVATAVTAGKAAEATKKDAEFAEASKSPLKTFVGPDEYGKVTAQYPKTWSAYNGTVSGQGLSAYFHPDVVPATGNYALRIEVLNQSYSNALAQYQNTKNITSSAYSLPKVPGVVGVKIDGEISTKVQGSMVVLPLRDKTLKIYTQSPEYLPDFNNNILPNLTFAP